jgi:hypothetical protein
VSDEKIVKKSGYIVEDGFCVEEEFSEKREILTVQLD